MLRTDNWKLCIYADDCSELYDLQSDPHELHNRYGDPEYALIQSVLEQRLMRRLLCDGQAPEDLPKGELP